MRVIAIICFFLLLSTYSRCQQSLEAYGFVGARGYDIEGLGLNSGPDVGIGVMANISSFRLLADVSYLEVYPQYRGVNVNGALGAHITTGYFTVGSNIGLGYVKGLNKLSFDAVTSHIDAYIEFKASTKFSAFLSARGGLMFNELFESSGTPAYIGCRFGLSYTLFSH